MLLAFVVQVICSFNNECDELCSNVCSSLENKTTPININICMTSCQKVCSKRSGKIYMFEEPDVVNTCESESNEDATSNCEINLNQLSFNDLKTLYKNTLSMKTQQTSFDTSDIKDLLQSLSSSTKKDNTTLIILESVVLALFICKPILMYYIQAKYKADAPHVRQIDELVEDQMDKQSVNKPSNKTKDVKTFDATMV